MYNSGYVALPGVVHVRRGETFIAVFRPRCLWRAEETPLLARAGGRAVPKLDIRQHGRTASPGGNSNCRGNASYANAVFRYEPNLAAADAWHDGTVERSANLAWQKQLPHLTAADDHAANVTFQHFSPYVICGDPVDDKDPMTGHATDGLVVTADTVGDVALDLSVDQGSTWQTIERRGQDARLDLTQYVKGRYGWWLRFTFSRGSGLNRLQTETTCQMNQAIYPRLNRMAQRSPTVQPPVPSR